MHITNFAKIPRKTLFFFLSSPSVSQNLVRYGTHLDSIFNLTSEYVGKILVKSENWNYILPEIPVRILHNNIKCVYFKSSELFGGYLDDPIKTLP
jgi:hypothetical protein